MFLLRLRPGVPRRARIISLPGEPAGATRRARSWGRILLVFLLLAAPASAGEVFVDVANGSDTTGDGSPAAPWRTITHALSQPVPATQIVWLRAGTYDSGSGEAWPLALAGRALRGVDRPTVVVRFDAATATAAIDAGLGSVENLTLTATSPPADAAGILNPARVRGCTVSGFRQGVEVNRSFPVVLAPTEVASVLEGNLLTRNTTGLAIRLAVDSGPLGAGVTDRSRIVNNLVVGNATGISLLGRPLGGAYALVEALVWNNTIADNSSDAVNPQNDRVAEGGNPEVVNNVIAFNGGWGVTDGTCGSARRISTNVFHANALGDLQSGVSATPDNVFADPGLADRSAGDYHLVAGSPAIDVGTQVGSPDVDFEGDARPLDGDLDPALGFDIGADERRVTGGMRLRRSLFTGLTPPVPPHRLGLPLRRQQPEIAGPHRWLHRRRARSDAAHPGAPGLAACALRDRGAGRGQAPPRQGRGTPHRAARAALSRRRQVPARPGERGRPVQSSDLRKRSEASASTPRPEPSSASASGHRVASVAPLRNTPRRITA